MEPGVKGAVFDNTRPDGEVGPPTIFVLCTSSERAAFARDVADRVGGTLLDAPPASGLGLIVADDGLWLKLLGNNTPGAIQVDFLRGRVARQRRETGFRQQPLMRAFGLHKRSMSERYRVVDATAGLGKDAGLLAAAGCHVIAIERSPVLCAMVQDGLDRLHAAGDVAESWHQRFELRPGDARAWLQDMCRGERRPCAVYLDPMFPPRKKAAAVKREMQILQALHREGPTESGQTVELLARARAAATERVVVKRPKGAPPLADDVDYRLEGEAIRYDVYLTRNRG